MMRRMPLVPVVLALAAGILLSEWVQFAFWQLLTAIALLAVGAMLLRRQTAAFLSCILAIWLLSGITLAEMHSPQRQSHHYSHFVSDRNTLIASVTKTATTPKCFRIEVAVEQVDSTPASGKMMLYLLQQGNTPPQQGDRICVSARVNEPFTADSAHDFDYRRFLAHKGITHTAFATDYEAIGHNVPSGLLGTAHQLQQRLLARIQSLGLSANQQGIAEAMLLGWSNDLPTTIREQFRDSGIAHLLCVSGLHVGIVSSILGWLLFLFGRSPLGRRLRGIIQLVGVWTFVLVTGMAPATTRAAILFSFFIVKDCFLLQGSSANILAASALIMLFVSPNLIHDVGFQLSYAAVAGIIAFHRPLYSLVPWPDEALLDKETDLMKPLERLRRIVPLRMAQKLMQLLCLTTAATLGTLPLTLLYFHQFPTYFLIANMTIVPCAGLLLTTIMGTLLMPQLAPILGWLLDVTDRITAGISQLPLATIEVHIVAPQALLIAAMVIVLWWMVDGRGLRTEG